jgi:hypothetical protein
MCAHCVSFDLLGDKFALLGETLAALILDYLISEVNAEFTTATAPLSTLHEYHVTSVEKNGSNIMLSWLSHGKCCEWRSNLLLYRLVSLAIVSRNMLPSIASKILYLSDLWQLSADSQPATHGYTNQDIMSLQVHTNCSHRPKKGDSAAEGKSDLRLRFLGMGKTVPAPVVFGIAPVCTFELSHAANVMLSEHYIFRHETFDTDSICDSISSGDGVSNTTTPESAFEGTRADFERGRDGVLEEIWANHPCQLDSWQQLYLSTCVKLYFKTLWRMLPTCGENEVSESNSGE